uniref:Uncharacterized protein n=1 Tax=Arundo donax TaxID=35708 RepID=A0A0A9C5J8_ARUDO
MVDQPRIQSQLGMKFNKGRKFISTQALIQYLILYI